MKKAALYAIIGAGTALAATPLMTFAHNASGEQAPKVPQTPEQCYERLAQIEEKMQNAPQKHAEMREKMMVKFEERIAEIPEDKREEARARFEAKASERQARNEEMKAKAADILERLRTSCDKSPEERKEILDEIRQEKRDSHKEFEGIRKEHLGDRKDLRKEFRGNDKNRPHFQKFNFGKEFRSN